MTTDPDVNPTFDWTRISDDPNHPQAKAQARTVVQALRKVHTDVDITGFVRQAGTGKRVLDVGVVSHATRYFERGDWRHARIRETASYCLGIDILEHYVEELRNRGFNIRCVDATSDADLGERFDVVFVGDVIEHVDNPSALLRFCARHLSPTGRMLVTTPNPFSRKFVRQFHHDGVMVVNLDHVAWFTPTQAMELARRLGISLHAYHLIKPMGGWEAAWKRFAWRFTAVEYSFPDYLYEFRLAAPQPG